MFIFGGTIAVLVGGYLAIRYMRVAENRSKLARRMEEQVREAGGWLWAGGSSRRRGSSGIG